MMRSLFSGVSGLKVHQTKMDVIGNNIANVNTVGFKASTVTFTDVFYQTTQSATGPNAETGAGGQNAKQIGLGASMGAIATNITTQGGAQRTDNPFDLMISGDGFFVVNKGSGNYFTKAGNFNVDEAGTLVNSSGYAVMGWQADSDGNIIKDRVSALKIMAESNMTTPPEATTQSTFFGNINQEDDSFTAADAKDQYVPLTMQFYDDMGYEYQATFHVKEAVGADADDSTRGKYTLDLYSIVKDGKEVLVAPETDDGAALDYAKTGFTRINLEFNTSKDSRYFKVDENGKYTELADGDSIDGAVEVAPGELLPNADYGYKLDMAFETIKTSAAIAAGYNGEEVFSAVEDIEIDLSQLTNYGSQSTIDSEMGYEGYGKGKSVGNMSNIGIQTDGKIVAAYSNGDNRVLGQIVVANFANAAGLEKVGDNLYAETLNSGAFNGIGEDITASGDSFSTGVLEMSNVDLSTEFTEMITTQRGFQSNSRIITTSDTMLEELINLKR